MWLLLDVHTRMKTLGNPKVQGVEEKVMIWPKQNVGRTLLYVNYIQMWPGEILSLRLSPWLAGWNSAFTSWVSLSWQGWTQRMSTGCEEWKDFIIHLPIWHLRPVKPAKHEQVKEGFPVMQSSMQRPPFWQGLKLAQTKAEEDNRKESEQTDIFLFVLFLMFSNLLDSSFSFLWWCTWVIAATHLHLRIINTKDPTTRKAHIRGGFNVNNIICPRAWDVEIAPPIASIKTCLGREWKCGRVLSEWFLS